MSVFTHTEHNPLEGILRFALQAFGCLNKFQVGKKMGKLGYFAVELQLAWTTLLIDYLDRMLDCLPHGESRCLPHQRRLPKPGLDVTPRHRCCVPG